VFGTRASLVHIAAILSDPERIQLLSKALRTTNPDLSNRLASEVGQLSSSEAANVTSWVVSKFAPFTSSRAMRAILGTGLDAVDIDAAMERGRGLLIDLGGPTLGTMQAQVLGAIWLLKHWLAMGRRRDVTRPHVIIVDEAHLFTYGALPQLLAESRKFGIGLVLATQSIDQLPAPLERAIEANAGTHVSLRLGTASALRASARFGGWPVDQFVRLPDLTAIASMNRGGQPTDPFTLELDHYSRSRRLGRINPPELIERVNNHSVHWLWEVTKSAAAPTDTEIVGILKSEATRNGESGRSAVWRALDEWSARGSDSLGVAR
jgi:hypothetical protein